jgi:hypothetical protein
MKLHVLFIIGFALCVAGCENKDQAAPEQQAAVDTVAPATESMAIDKTSYKYEGILRHMHAHADQIDLINEALADDDLEATKVPARWLWRHDTLHGVPDGWQPYLSDMRQAARDLGSANDLATARAAAARVIAQCQGCHAAVGMETNVVEPDVD